MTTELKEISYTPEQIDLIKRTERDERTGCLLWTGAKNAHGYGVVERGGVNRYVHRLVARASPGQVIRHSCDTPACINPEHLLIGTQAENIADAVRRGRIAHGERLPQTKLAAEVVAAIRTEYANGGVTQAELGRKYGVHQVRISQIVRGKSWVRS